MITCNYDGVKKSKTRIGEKAFIGSDVQLIAPVEIGDEAYVAAGTTLTRSISKDDLAIGRPELKVKEGYASKLKKRFLAAKEKLKKENQ